MKKIAFGNSLLLFSIVLTQITMGTVAVYAGIITAIAGLFLSVLGFVDKEG